MRAADKNRDNKLTRAELQGRPARHLEDAGVDAGEAQHAQPPGLDVDGPGVVDLGVRERGRVRPLLDERALLDFLEDRNRCDILQNHLYKIEVNSTSICLARQQLSLVETLLEL